MSRMALEGLTVVDLTTFISGPYCTMLLADAGAEIIKIERPEGGDEMRRIPPFVKGESAPFMLLNRNKKSLCLDLKKPEDIDQLKALIGKADILVENFRPGVCDKLGIGYEQTAKLNPRLIYCSISGFGQSGTYRTRGGFDLIAQAMSGLMSINVDAAGMPMRMPVPISDICSGMFATIGILTALTARQTSGRGQRVDLSLLESALALGVYEAASYFATGERPKPLGQKHRGSAPYQAFKCSDDWLVLGAGPQNLWEKLCDVLDMRHLVADIRFKDAPTRVKNCDALADILAVRLAEKSRAEWLVGLEKAGIPAGPVLNFDEIYADPHILERHMIRDVVHAKAGRMQLLGSAPSLSETPFTIRSPAPLLGEHSEEIARRFSTLAE